MFGQDGIITKAQEAGRKTKEAAQNEQEFLDFAQDYLDNYSSGRIAEKMADAGITGDPKSLSDVVDGVPIPKGFTASTKAGENTKAGGLVIIDNGTTKNEFVWVPVKDLVANGTRDGITYNEQFGIRLFERPYPYGNEWTDAVTGELVASVEDYGGFYMARYEASYDDGKPASVKSTTATIDPWTPTNGRLWNWSYSSMTACENMYASDASVVSHLPYGANWDSTLQWFKQTEFGNNNALIGSNSSSWGNYDDSSFTYGPSSTPKPSGVDTIINTGSTDYTKVNNIYDMAGNLWERTQETPEQFRGGGFKNSSNNTPVGIRDSDNWTNAGGVVIGFRVALYIK